MVGWVGVVCLGVVGCGVGVFIVVSLEGDVGFVDCLVGEGEGGIFGEGYGVGFWDGWVGGGFGFEGEC